MKNYIFVSKYGKDLSFEQMLLLRRKELHLSQMELANKAGISRARVSMLERGSNINPTIDTIIKLSEALEWKCELRISFDEKDNQDGYSNKISSCSYDPMTADGPIGMFHCPECGEMVVAGMEHPDYSLLDEIGIEDDDKEIE